MDVKLVLLLVLLAVAGVLAQPVGDKDVSADSMEKRDVPDSKESEEKSETTESTESVEKRDASESDESVKKVPAKREDKRQTTDSSVSDSSDSSDSSSSEEQSQGARWRRQTDAAAAATAPMVQPDDADDNSTQTLYLIKTVTYEVGLAGVSNDSSNSLVIATVSPVEEKEVVTIFYDAAPNTSTPAPPVA